MSFFNTDPPAQKATLQSRQQFTNDFSTFVSSQYPASATPVAPGCTFGQDPDDVTVAQNLFASSPISTTDSEALGEQGAIAYLQATLEQQNVEYDDSCLHIFAGAHAFNLVYFDKPLPNATKAIILEAKGGNSGCGTRQSATGATVTQGTIAYAKDVIGAMKQSSASDRSTVGTALSTLANANNGSISYVGVRTKYNKSAQSVYDPVPFFHTTI
jgi:hypothetical protein